MNEFKRDEPRSGRAVESATPEIIEKVHDLILNDRRVKMWEIFYEKASSIRVPRLLTVENKRNRMTNSMAASAFFPRNPSEF